MMVRMLSRWNRVSSSVGWMSAAILLAMPLGALADDTLPLEARLQGYKDNIYAAPGATATQWLSLIGIGIVCMGVMFYSAKRTHLD